jgi:flagellar protein FlgJ
MGNQLSLMRTMSMPEAKLPSIPLAGLPGADKDEEAKQLEAAATQFEGLFMHMMLKSMRAVNRVFSEGNYLSSFETGMYEDMLDEKLSTSMSSTHALGIADMMIRQLSDQPRPSSYSLPMGTPVPSSREPSSREPSSSAPSSSAPALSAPSLTAPLSAVSFSTSRFSTASFPGTGSSAAAFSITPADKSLELGAERVVRRPPVTKVEPAQRQAVFDTPQAFVEGLKTEAQATAAQLGLAPQGLLAQAALESGWGKHVIHDGAGANSHNLFGIKAGKAWEGATVAIASVEVSDGVVGRQVSNFKRYESYRQAFDDYARLLQGNERYQRVLQAGDNTADFAKRLGESGYATDPEYSKKIDRVMTHPALVASLFTVKEG